VLVVACVSAVVLMLGLFAYAPVSQAPAWTVASSGFQALSGNGCGLATDVKVLLPSHQQLGPARGPAKLEGDFLAGQPPALPLGPWADQALLWHDDRPEGTTTGTGSLTTGWYPLPPDGGTHVSVPVAGALGGQRLEVQFGTGDPAAPRVVQTQKLEPDTRQPLDFWQQLPAPLPAQRPTAVRVLVSDMVTGTNSWIAVAEPRLTELRSVDELTTANPVGVGGPHQGVSDATVFADMRSSPLWPCVRQARIVNGISDAPTVRLTADEFIPEPILSNPTSPTWGGAWVQATRASQQIKLYSELRPQGPPRLPWGQVFAVRYRYPVGQYDLRVDKVTRSGLTRLPSLANNAYADIAWNEGIHPLR
jgi:arabinosyltransferase B/arabinosyltransferase C